MIVSNHKDQRKRALQDIIRQIQDASLKDESTQTIRQSFDELNSQLVQVLNDSVEACRDLAVDALQKYFNNLSPEERDLNYIIPTFSRRLGSQERIEISEEIRLKCVCLLKLIIPKYKSYLPIYVDCLLQILTQTLADTYPLVKRESCECVCILAKNLSRSAYPQLENLVKPTLLITKHRHYKVRVVAINTIGELLIYSSKSMEEVASVLAERLFDQNALVRAAVVEVAGKWLIDLPDRYSWFHKILPLLLTGLHDTVTEIRDKSAELWDKAGKQYLEENKNDEKLKDRMDYLTEPPKHYPKVSRPNLGCRVLAQLHFSKLINGLAFELLDWMLDIKIRSAQLLCVFLLHVEEDVTQHIEKILPSMYRACNNDEGAVKANVEQAAEYIGYFVSPEIYCPLVLPTIEESPTFGHLRVLAAILKGSNRTLLTPKLKEITNFLRQPHISQSKNEKYQKGILSCCGSLLCVCDADCADVSEALYTIIFTIFSIAVFDQIKEEAKTFLTKLESINKCEGPDDLHKRHAPQLLSSLTNYGSWSVHTPDSLIFSAYLSNSVYFILCNQNILLPILRETMSTDSDPELRLQYFILLSKLFSRPGIQDTQDAYHLLVFINDIIENCISTNLVWNAGRSAEAVRTSAACCLKSFLYEYLKLPGIIRGFSFGSERRCQYFRNFCSTIEKIVPMLISLISDYSIKTRLYSLQAIRHIIVILGGISEDRQDIVHQVSAVVLERLDDGCDDVREQALYTVTEIWNQIGSGYDVLLNKAHVDMLYTTMIIHLDDCNQSFRMLLCDNLRQLASIYPELLYQKLNDSISKFKNPHIIRVLIEDCQSILRG